MGAEKLAEEHRGHSARIHSQKEHYFTPTMGTYYWNTHCNEAQLRKPEMTYQINR